MAWTKSPAHFTFILSFLLGEAEGFPDSMDMLGDSSQLNSSQHHHPHSDLAQTNTNLARHGLDVKSSHHS
jgi:hypothetical protein